MFERMFILYSDIIDTIGFVIQADREVGEAMKAELNRQQRNIELIASENFVSPAVMAGNLYWRSRINPGQIHFIVIHSFHFR